MAQPNFIPLTLTIIPQAQASIPNSSSIASTTPANAPMPTFQYNTYTLNPSNGPSLNELEQKRIQKQREKASRYERKVREYKKLGTLDRENDKIRGLLLLCRPYLKDMDPAVLDYKISQFLQSL